MTVDRETPDDELELLQRWQSGDKKAGAVLFERYYAPIKRFFLSKRIDDVEDAMQDTFAAVHRGRDRIRTTSFRCYLFGTAHNVMRAALRRRHPEPFDSCLRSIADLSPGLSSLIAASDAERVLQLALQRIPLDHQVVLELYYYEKMTGPEIAEVLDLPQGTVRARLRRALIRLEETIKEVEASPELLDQTLRDFSKWRDDIRRLAELDDGDDD
jgi:RNA polymerase sigma factor (sigma-70 family)